MLAHFPKVLASQKQPHVSGDHLTTYNGARPVRSDCAILSLGYPLLPLDVVNIVIPDVSQRQ